MAVLAQLALQSCTLRWAVPCGATPGSLSTGKDKHHYPSHKGPMRLPVICVCLGPMPFLIPYTAWDLLTSSSVMVTVTFTCVVKLISVLESPPRAACHTNCGKGKTTQAQSWEKVSYGESSGERDWGMALGVKQSMHICGPEFRSHNPRKASAVGHVQCSYSQRRGRVRGSLQAG